MKKILSKRWLLAAAALCMLAVSCEEKTGETAVPYLEAVPENYTETALGEGDGFLVSVRANVPWTLSAIDAAGGEVDWIRFDRTSGEGDADVFGVILRGDREADRSCTILLRSEDGKLERRLEIKQGVFVPTLMYLQLSDVVKTGYPLEAGATESLTDFGVFEAEVVGVPGGNLPEGYVYLTDDGSTYIRAAVPNAAALQVGDKVQVEMTSGTVTKDSFGGYTANLSEPIRVLSSGTPSVQPAYIAPEAVSRYENALVVLRSAQAQDAFVGKEWSGDIGLLSTDETEKNQFQAHVESGASFGTVPDGNGAITGIVVDGKVRPRSASDLSFTDPRGTVPAAPHQIEPVACFLHIGSAANKFGNVTISDATKVTFEDDPGYSIAGASIEKVVGTANKLTPVVAVATPFQICFTTIQWHLAGTHLLYTIPVRQKLYGDLEFSFSISCGTAKVFPGDWEVSWSPDGTRFNPVDAVYSTSQTTEAQATGNTFPFASTGHQSNRHVAEFSIPESEALTSGNLYIKLDPPAVESSKASTTLRMNCGFVLSSRTTNTPNHHYHNVVAMENFEGNRYGHNPVVGVPTYYFVHMNGAPGYINTEGWAVSGNSTVCRGCLRLSNTEGANFIMSPVLDMLKAPTDLTLTFKVAPFVNPTGATLAPNDNHIAVALTGSGTLGEIAWDSDYEPYRWRTGTVKISGASSDTQIQIGNLDPETTRSQFYIDDIMIIR